MAYNKEFSDKLRKDKDYQEYLNSGWCTLNTAKGKINLNKVAFAACCACGIIMIPTNAIMTGTLTIGKLAWPVLFGSGAVALRVKKKQRENKEDKEVKKEVKDRAERRR